MKSVVVHLLALVCLSYSPAPGMTEVTLRRPVRYVGSQLIYADFPTTFSRTRLAPAGSEARIRRPDRQVDNRMIYSGFPANLNPLSPAPALKEATTIHQPSRQIIGNEAIHHSSPPSLPRPVTPSHKMAPPARIQRYAATPEPALSADVCTDDGTFCASVDVRAREGDDMDDDAE